MINPEIPENPFSHHNGSMLIFYELDHSFRKISDGLFVITHTHTESEIMMFLLLIRLKSVLLNMLKFFSWGVKNQKSSLIHIGAISWSNDGK